MEDNMKEFVAFSKKLLRALIKLRKCIEENRKEDALDILDELIEDTKGDIEA